MSKPLTDKELYGMECHFTHPSVLRAIADIRTLRGVDKELQEVGKELNEMEADNIKLRKALEGYAECCDECTCGDGWDHTTAIAVLKGRN